VANNEDDSYRDGAQGNAFAGSTFSERLAYDKGRGSAGGGGGVPLLPLLVGGAFFAVGAASFWPIAGIGGLGTYVYMRSYLSAARPPFDPGTALLLLFVPSGLGLYVGIKIERWLAHSTLYRRVRYPLRLVLTAAFLTYFVLTLNGIPYVVEPITLRWIDRHLSPAQYNFIFFGVIVVHFLSRKFDERYEVLSLARRVAKKQGRPADADLELLASSIAEERAAERKRRRAHRLRVGSSIGAIAAVLLALFGENAGSVIAGFIVFGGLAAMFSRFIPWPLFGRKRPAQAGSVSASALRPHE
jgi:hypothetical protein